MISPVIESVPVDTSFLGRDTAGILKQGIHGMERERKWSGKGGIAELLGIKGSVYIEEVLARGGAVLEVGGGKMTTTRELANKFPMGKLVIVEPFVDQDDTADLPGNIKVIPKKLEETGDDLDAGSMDGAFSGGHVLNYVEDKLWFLAKVWESLAGESRAYVEFMGSPISPMLEQIVKKFNLKESLIVTDIGSGNKVLEMIKKPDTKLSFGKYKVTTSIAGNFTGDVNSEYQFVE